MAGDLHVLQSSVPVAFPPFVYISKVMIRLLLDNHPEAHLKTTVSMSGLPHIYIYPCLTPLEGYYYVPPPPPSTIPPVKYSAAEHTVVICE